jgi:hypothetical protein
VRCVPLRAHTRALRFLAPTLAADAHARVCFASRAGRRRRERLRRPRLLQHAPQARPRKPVRTHTRARAQRSAANNNARPKLTRRTRVCVCAGRCGCALTGASSWSRFRQSTKPRTTSSSQSQSRCAALWRAARVACFGHRRVRASLPPYADARCALRVRRCAAPRACTSAHPPTHLPTHTHIIIARALTHCILPLTQVCADAALPLRRRERGS